jgi:hypothetical protein
MVHMSTGTLKKPEPPVTLSKQEGHTTSSTTAAGIVPVGAVAETADLEPPLVGSGILVYAPMLSMKTLEPMSFTLELEDSAAAGPAAASGDRLWTQLVGAFTCKSMATKKLLQACVRKGLLDKSTFLEFNSRSDDPGCGTDDEATMVNHLMAYYESHKDDDTFEDIMTYIESQHFDKRFLGDGSKGSRRECFIELMRFEVDTVSNEFDRIMADPIQPKHPYSWDDDEDVLIDDLGQNWVAWSFARRYNVDTKGYKQSACSVANSISDQPATCDLGPARPIHFTDAMPLFVPVVRRMGFMHKTMIHITRMFVSEAAAFRRLMEDGIDLNMFNFEGVIPPVVSNASTPEEKLRFLLHHFYLLRHSKGLEAVVNLIQENYMHTRRYGADAVDEELGAVNSGYDLCMEILTAKLDTSELL